MQVRARSPAETQTKMFILCYPGDGNKEEFRSFHSAPSESKSPLLSANFPSTATLSNFNLVL